jgi:hypothetical protein
MPAVTVATATAATVGTSQLRLRRHHPSLALPSWRSISPTLTTPPRAARRRLPSVGQSRLDGADRASHEAGGDGQNSMDERDLHVPVTLGAAIRRVR